MSKFKKMCNDIFKNILKKCQTINTDKIKYEYTFIFRE